MSSTEGLQHQAWSDLDVSYFRWEPPVFPGAPSSAAEQLLPGAGKSRRVESAFAHSSFPTSFAGWDKVRAANATEAKAAEVLAARDNEAVEGPLGHQSIFPSSSSEPDPYAAQSTVPGFPVAALSSLEATHIRAPIGGQGTTSAFTSLRQGERQQPVNPSTRNLSWPSSQSLPGDQLNSLAPPYGGAFDNLFQSKQPAGLRYGVPEGAGPQEGSPASSRAASVGQSSLPILLVQCGKFAAPVQRERGRQPGAPPRWPGQHPHGKEGFVGHWQGQKGQTQLQRASSGTDPLQLQEYYAAQSDIIEELIKGHNTRDPSLLAAAVHGNAHSHEMDHDFLDMLGPAHFGRATSVLDVPRVSSGASPHDLEPYMPQWQSESVPAELPNHVVNRLLMGGAPQADSHRHSRGLLGTKRDWSGLPSMQSIPDDQELPSTGFQLPAHSQPSGQRNSHDNLQSQDVDDLEELARTADVEVAHRAFLVPPHKKRGKGGRQPAADPRLDPNIDARRAKRILANRLSAARSKMKQKNQMDSLAGMVKELEEHGKQLREDAAELMEVCEETEFENRRLVRQAKVLEEFGRRQVLQHSSLLQQQINASARIEHQPPSSQNETPQAINSGAAQMQDAPARSTEALKGFSSKPSTDSLLRGLQGALAGDGLFEFPRED